VKVKGTVKYAEFWYVRDVYLWNGRCINLSDVLKDYEGKEVILTVTEGDRRMSNKGFIILIGFIVLAIAIFAYFLFYCITHGL